MKINFESRRKIERERDRILKNKTLKLKLLSSKILSVRFERDFQECISATCDFDYLLNEAIFIMSMRVDQNNVAEARLAFHEKH